jgi:hypothetical protein
MEEINEKQIYKEAMEQTPETLGDFVVKAMCDYPHDYGSVCVAVSACALAGVYAANSLPQGGITGYQAGFVMWEFIRQMNYRGNKCGLRMIDYDNMLFPQYAYKFEKTISSDTWKLLQEEAKRNLEEDLTYVHPAVMNHWKSIVDGVVPFGYKIEEEK